MEEVLLKKLSGGDDGGSYSIRFENSVGLVTDVRDNVSLLVTRRDKHKVASETLLIVQRRSLHLDR